MPKEKKKNSSRTQRIKQKRQRKPFMRTVQPETFPDGVEIHAIMIDKGHVSIKIIDTINNCELDRKTYGTPRDLNRKDRGDFYFDRIMLFENKLRYLNVI